MLSDPPHCDDMSDKENKTSQRSLDGNPTGVSYLLFPVFLSDVRKSPSAGSRKLGELAQTAEEIAAFFLSHCRNAFESQEIAPQVVTGSGVELPISLGFTRRPCRPISPTQHDGP